MANDRLKALKVALRNGPHAWPGGYPVYFYTNDGRAVSFKWVKENVREVMRDIYNREREAVYGSEINWEDPSMYCDETGERIESAYAEDNAEA